MRAGAARKEGPEAARVDGPGVVNGRLVGSQNDIRGIAALELLDDLLAARGHVVRAERVDVGKHSPSLFSLEALSGREVQSPLNSGLRLFTNASTASR